MKKILAREKVFGEAGIFPTTVLSNHDLPRATSRYIHGEDDRQAKILVALLLTLRGTPYMYQGEEIGMRDVSLKYKEVVDPPGKKYWPIYPGRDGCRSPMQWNNTAFAGFSHVKPWMKIHKNYHERNVASQEKDPGSLLNFTRKLIQVRKNHPALYRGDFSPVLATRHILAYTRNCDEESILVLCNFSKGSKAVSLPGLQIKSNLLDPGKMPVVGGECKVVLGPYEVALISLAAE